MENQRIRIQSPAIPILKDDPFAHDLLEREASSELLTRIVSRIEGPCVLAIDAPWGHGKTTFLNMWTQWLRNEGFPVVAFNAWETDFTDRPFLALSAELVQELDAYTTVSMDQEVKAFTGTLKEAVQVVIPKLAKGIPVIGLASEAALQLLPAFSTDDYQAARKAIRQFEQALTDLAGKLAENQSDRSLIIMIDELDRCRPSYAVELLEVAKHFFAVDNVVFVLAVNRAELAHSVRALYGSGFDAEGYLRRFFDIDFQLPEPDRGKFVENLLEATHLAEWPSNRESRALDEEREAAASLLKIFLGSPSLSLRRVQQAAHRFGLVLALLPDDSALLAVTAVISIVVRTVDFKVYQHFMSGQATDEEIADVVFRLRNPESWHQSRQGWLIESYIILGRLLISSEYRAGERELSKINSPLLQKYRKSRSKLSHEDQLLTYLESLWREIEMSGRNSEVIYKTFLQSIQKLELLSPDLRVGE